MKIINFLNSEAARVKEMPHCLMSSTTVSPALPLTCEVQCPRPIYSFHRSLSAETSFSGREALQSCLFDYPKRDILSRPRVHAVILWVLMSIDPNNSHGQPAPTVMSSGHIGFMNPAQKSSMALTQQQQRNPA